MKMRLLGKDRDLKHIFMTATVPAVTEFNGEYLVDMLTVWPSFKRFSHRKIFYRKGSRVAGHNVILNKSWGHFIVEQTLCKNIHSAGAALINYNLKENSLLVRGIRDHVRCIIKDDLYIGRFNHMFCGRLCFLGYFSLEKIK
ncbi:MAG: hypothetical protein OEU95_04895 [Nitrospirota bacterium]|nr:hypothetical protein [Nitrospirota bacterium]